MKLFLYRCLVFFLFSVALALIACPWTDASVQPVSVSDHDLLTVVVENPADTAEFTELEALDFPQATTTARRLASEHNGNAPKPSRIGLREFKRICVAIGQKPNCIARIRVDGVSMVLWYGEYIIELPVSLPYFSAMRKSIGWILLFFGVLLTRRIYAPPPLLPRSLTIRVIFWDVLAILALTITAFFFLQYLATAVYGLTPSTDAEMAQILALVLYVPLLPVLSALISTPCLRANPHF